MSIPLCMPVKTGTIMEDKLNDVEQLQSTDFAFAAVLTDGSLQRVVDYPVIFLFQICSFNFKSL